MKKLKKKAVKKSKVKPKKRPVYKDPLHIPSAQLEIKYKGYHIILNKTLLDQQMCWHNVEGIKALHYAKAAVYDAIENTNDENTLYSLSGALQEIEFALQDAWGFPKDLAFHRFWEYPKCMCPSLDNRDMYPSSRRIISMDCALHHKKNDDAN